MLIRVIMLPVRLAGRVPGPAASVHCSFTSRACQWNARASRDRGTGIPATGTHWQAGNLNASGSCGSTWQLEVQVSRAEVQVDMSQSLACIWNPDHLDRDRIWQNGTDMSEPCTDMFVLQVVQDCHCAAASVEPVHLEGCAI